MGAKQTSIYQIEPGPALKHDAKLWISTGRNRFDQHWKNKELSWSAILSRLQQPNRTPETLAEYMKASKKDQDSIKDVGGFVGGTLKDGKRGSHTVTGRTIISFDLDFAPPGFYDDYLLAADYASACYSTHKHRPEHPRLRLLIPLSRTVTADEYEAIARMLATDIGMEYMDPSTFQPSRLMYWPSCSSDAEYYFNYQDAPFLDADRILARYPDWTDASQWPVSNQETKQRTSLADKQQDPTTKRGVVGAFCRTYTVTAAIDTFLADVYTPTARPDRYTYAAGSTSGGLVIYDGDLFAFSNHGTDPAGGQLLNAFDLVRIHKFMNEDEDVPENTPTNKRPSYDAMCEFALKDSATKTALYKSEHPITAADFDDDGGDAAVGKKKPKLMACEEVYQHLELTGNKNGSIKKTVKNARLIFEHDIALQGIALNLLADQITVLPDHPVPWDRRKGGWNDTDDAQLYTYVAENYTEFPRVYVMDQKAIAAQRQSFHPIKEYLEALPAWDGVPRVDTLLVDYLGAEDTIFTREATAKILLAAVRRIFEPGCKFDSMLVLSGPPSTGKSTLISRLAGEWFSDSLTFEDMKDKTAAEKLQGYWIMEIGEMKGMRKMDVESIKSFISRQDDVYRAAYARNTESHLRQSVIFGTVNDLSGYLKDVTGNRRFWPITVTGQGKYHAWDMTEDDRAQIWAEVLQRYKDGDRNLVLSPAADKIASEKQIEAMEQDDREGMVEEYLEKLLPVGWESMDIDRRLEFLTGDESLAGEHLEGTERRTRVSNIEVWVECFREQARRIQAKDSYAIASIMKRLGWERGDREQVPFYGRQRVYYRKK